MNIFITGSYGQVGMSEQAKLDALPSFSTDYIFAGDKAGAYTEAYDIASQGMYGPSRLAGNGILCAG